LNYEKRLLELYEIAPFEHHPLWVAVKNRALSLGQVIAAERQHFLRTKAGQLLRKEAVEHAKASNERIWGALMSIYLEEVVGKDGPSHLDLIRRLCMAGGGVSASDLDATIPTPPNTAAMALYRDITNRGAACHLLGAGCVEFYYSKLAPRIYETYTGHYGMTAEQAETYRIHGPMDDEHAKRSLAILPDAIAIVGWPTIELSVRDAFIATSLHYDGMLQGATGNLSYWNGGQK
jgi:pyrroloquinoline quinone (PQQ) biosynthesis protein C